ncbi:dATP/dGTP diphosphohydrolase domain-containing protein [Paraburkholderia sp. A3RO-2L]|uniref:dATP/dGTP diphosphohydrolase domain-containing protein n=1 Tax=Paraburkholderia sp. A3RO-2L TaxID=3028376 RepID=UPI003DA819EC
MTAKPSNPKDLVGVRKAPMSTVSAAVMAEVGVAMLEGAAKYGRHNYRAVGVRASVYYDATIRHLFSWWEGEDIDPDSGMSHITKAITSLVVLRDAMIQNMMTDDRPPISKDFYAALNAAAGAILDRHADKNPQHFTIADSAREGA